MKKRIFSLFMAFVTAITVIAAPESALAVKIRTVFAAESGAAVDETVGSERAFRLPWGGGGVVDATLAAKSANSLVYAVKSDALSSYKDFYPVGASENTRAKEIAAEFEKMYALVSTPGRSSYYAKPYDVDGSGKVVILLCDVAGDGKESGGTSGGYVSGLFNAGDFTNVNKAAMVYVDVSPNQGYSQLKSNPKAFYSTLMHEYAHLLSFSCVYTHRQTGKPGTNQKDVFAEEAFAELAAYLYSGQFGTGKLSAFFTNQFQPRYSFLDWQNSGVYAQASYGAAVLLALAYYNHGGNINNFLTDARSGPNDSFIAWGDHYVGASAPSSTFDNFDKLFNQFALDTYVCDPSGRGPHIKNVSFNSWNLIDLYNQPVLKPGEDFYFSYRQAPYMPQYFVRPRWGTQLSADTNAVRITLTDADANSRFYVVYPREPFSGFGETAGRAYTELVPGRATTVPVGQGNKFAVVAVNFIDGYTHAVINYTAVKDASYPFVDLQAPDVRNLKVSHAKDNVSVSWDAPASVPAGLKLTSYEVYRGDVLIGTVSSTASSRTDSYSNLKVGDRYEYTVKAVAQLTADASVKITSPGVKVAFELLPISVAPPENVAAELAADAKSVKISWEKAVFEYGPAVRRAAPSGYEIYRNDELIYTAGSSRSDYTDKTVEPGKSYAYKIRSKYTSGGETVYSKFTASVKAAAPAVRTVTFNPNGGTLSVDAKTKKLNNNEAVGTLPAPTRKGHTFQGWYTSKTGGTKITSSTKITADKTYYARWKINSHTVKFDPNGGTVSTASKKRDYNAEIGSLPKPKLSGYAFMGWYTSKTGGTKITTETKVTADKTYYARWEKKPARPGSPKAAAKSESKITVSWKKVSGADGYEVYRATSKDGEYARVKRITKGSTVSWGDTGLKSNKTYYYKIRSYKTVDGKRVYSSYTAVKSAKTKS
ncbi:MAG: InlB B-repeat-containing protein [Oscillospiraceae bacterium]|jgi:uncharacterized repeat protein (TIGR02543 family)|nr:InlB B-repeat-containing protein [Oscillospiraceae bacterium]